MTKKDARATLKTLTASVVDFVRQIGEETRAHESRVDAIRLRIGRVFAEAESSLATLEEGFIAWATEAYNEVREDYGLAKVSPPTLYRWKNAGTVAAILGDLVPEDAGVGSLVPLYRIRQSAKTAEEVGPAEELIRAAYQSALDASDGTPTFATVLAEAEKIAPPSRGSASESSDESSDDSEEETGSEEVSSQEETFTVNGETLTVVSGNVSSFLAKTAKDTGTDIAILKSVMAWTAMACQEYDPRYVVAALSSK